MREIEFRGKTPEGKWIYGGISITNDRAWIDQGFIGREWFGDTFVDKDTIGQYTGMKDKNGVKIFEGDILKIPEWLKEDIQDVCICIYNQKNTVSDIIGFGLYIKDGYSGKYKILVQSDEWDEFEVIGNKFDNPELLKEN